MPEISEKSGSVLNMTDEELLFKARKSNEAEAATIISALISRYMRIIIIKANKTIKHKHNKIIKPDKEDLISEGFLGLLSAIRAFDEGKGSFANFANTCIDNKIKSSVIGFKSMPLMSDDFDIMSLKDTAPLADDVLIEKESKAELSSKLRNVLSAHEFNVLGLYINDYSYNLISEKLGISTKSVDNALSRARIKLKKHYGKINAD